MKDYEYIVFDAQYFLVRNFSALMSRTEVPTVRFLKPGEGDTSIGYPVTSWEFTPQDLVKQFFWSVCKMIRDNFSCHKVILLWDCAPYHKTSILGDFKGDRVHHCEANLEDWDIDADPAAFLQERERVKIEDIKQTAKYWIINNLGKFGMPSVIHKGYEADDLAYIFTHLDVFETGELKSAICSADSDWMYWISNKFDYINFNKTEVWTVDDVIGECSGFPTELGIDLFETKMYSDSLFLSHNGLKRTTNRTWKSFKEIVTNLKSGNYEDLVDVETFKLNMKSFEIWNYPDYAEVKQKLTTALTGGNLIWDEFYKFQKDGFSVSENYAKTYFDLLTPEYYVTG